MVKSRTQAGEFCRAGKVLVNGVKSKPAKNLKLEDVVEVEFPVGTKKYRVLRFLEKRGKEEMADGCFEDLNPAFGEIAAEKTKEISTQKRDTRKTKFRYGDGRESKKDKRSRRDFQDF